MKDKIFGVLQRVGRSFMLPIALLPVAGLLLGIGSSFTNETMLEAYGLTGIILFPLCAGLAAQCFNCRWKLLHQRQERGNPTVFLLLGIGCSIATVLALILGCLELISKFR